LTIEHAAYVDAARSAKGEHVIEEVLIQLRSETAMLPQYQTDGAAGMDMHADIPAPVIIEPGERFVVNCGFAIQLPAHLEAQVRSRSGLAVKYGVIVLNAPGTIDSDYRGSIGAILYNTGTEPFTVNPGDRVAQLVICPIVHSVFKVVKALDASARNAGGFGSTGIAA
jgi:dUTP pyrophosphatase